MAHAIAQLMPRLRQLDLMIESAEIRRDRAYRELERRRANLAKQLRDAVDKQIEVEVANDKLNGQLNGQHDVAPQD
jgi:predicted  nucleic acid-binding Zn-ribbon protein